MQTGYPYLVWAICKFLDEEIPGGEGFENGMRCFGRDKVIKVSLFRTENLIWNKLKPIINGTGNYYLEAQTRDAGRTDVIVDYLGEQFVVEMKIWCGR